VRARTASLAERPVVEALVKAVGREVKTYGDIHGLREHYQAGHVWLYDEPPRAPVGFAVAVDLKREPVTSVYEFGVHPDSRRKGFGRAFLLDLAGDRTVRLVTGVDNTTAINFYLSCGLSVLDSFTTRHGQACVRLEGHPC
jgi:ribosomal protein S18 acetylase RimI-like enzyme